MIAPDGSPVAVYRVLPEQGEAAVIHAAIPAGAGILELGCGAGRVTAALLALGHPVTGVDASREMLAAAAERAPGAALVEAAIEGLELRRCYGAVVLGSHLVNAATPQRRALLAAAAQHVEDGGAVLIEAYPPGLDWASLVGRTAVMGEVRSTVTRASVEGSQLRASVRYQGAGGAWEHAFEAELLDEADLRAELATASLAFDRWLDGGRGWLVARPSGPRGQ